MKDFTPLGLHLLGPSSMAWAFVLAKLCSNLCLNESNSLGTYSNEFKMSKYIRNDYLFTQFGLQMLSAWPFLLVALGFKIIQGKNNLYKIAPLPLKPIPMCS